MNIITLEINPKKKIETVGVFVNVYLIAGDVISKNSSLTIHHIHIQKLIEYISGFIIWIIKNIV